MKVEIVTIRGKGYLASHTNTMLTHPQMVGRLLALQTKSGEFLWKMKKN